MTREPSLFDTTDDSVDEAAAHTADAPNPRIGLMSMSSVVSSSEVYPPRSEWVEVTEEVFLSWSWVEQLMYCAARDIDSALHTGNETDRDWFLARAQSYREMIHE